MRARRAMHAPCMDESFSPAFPPNPFFHPTQITVLQGFPISLLRVSLVTSMIDQCPIRVT